MITVHFQALGMARRSIVPSKGTLELEEPVTAGDLMERLGILGETAIRPVIAGTAVPLDTRLSDGAAVTFVVLVTAG